MNDELAIRRYEQYLLGNSAFYLTGNNLLPDTTFAKDPDADVNPEQEEDIVQKMNASTDEERKQALKRQRLVAQAKERNALAIVRYAVKILGWTPQEAMECMTPEIIQQLKLDKIMQYIIYPRDLDKKKDYDYMIYKAFPNEVRYDRNRQILKTYDRVLKGEISRFPRQLFTGEDGPEKLAILLKEYISKNIPAASTEDLYEYFGDSGKANEMLNKAKFYNIYRDIYETPLDYLHASLGRDQDQFLYNYYQFMSAYKETVREEKK